MTTEKEDQSNSQNEDGLPGNVLSLVPPATHAGDQDLREEVAALQRDDPKLTQNQIAKQSGVSQARLNQWLHGKYKGDPKPIEHDIANWLAAYRERQIVEQALPAAPVWVRTQSARRIMSALAYAQIARDIAVIYGMAGLGKTRTAQEHQRISPNVWIATMSPATTGVVPALEQIAEAMGLKNAGGGARKLQTAIIERIAGTQGLLIVDEAQHLTPAALDAVRALHDATEVGIALMGNEVVYARLTGGDRAAYLDRLFSRVGRRTRLRHATPSDIEAMLDAWGITKKTCRKLLHEIAGKAGALRGMTKTLQLAISYAGGDVKKLTPEDIQMAWREMWEEE